MNENEQENEIVTPNDSEPTENTEEVEIELDEVDEVEKLRKENETLKAQKDHWRDKATKKVEAPKDFTSDISTTDLYSLVAAKVSQDDVPEVKEYAKMKGITVTEALKTSFIKILLNDREEQRATAKATNVANGRRSSAKLSDDALVNKARKGELPDDDDELDRLIRLRREQSRPKR